MPNPPCPSFFHILSNPLPLSADMLHDVPSSQRSQKMSNNKENFTDPEQVFMPSCPAVSSRHCAIADRGSFFYRN